MLDLFTFTNSKVALTEFVVSNKEYREKDRGKALDFLLDCLLALAEQNGCRYAHVFYIERMTA